MSDIKKRLRDLTSAVPYGVDTLLRLLDVVETTEIETAAVPVGGTPRLLVNPHFVAAHCRTDEAFTMLILHELHHLLLGHTRLFTRITAAHNIAFDAVINAMLCRQHPQPEWTALFRKLYSPNKFPELLLRPPHGFPNKERSVERVKPGFRRIMKALYYTNSGTFGEVFELLVRQLVKRAGAVGMKRTPAGSMPTLLGNHDEDERGVESTDGPLVFDVIRKVVERWPQPPDPKVGRSLESILREGRVLPSPTPPDRVFRRALLAAARTGGIAAGPPSPVSSPAQRAWPTRDRRAFAQAAGGGAPLLYVTSLPGRPRRTGISKVDVYIDVSGSCNHFIPLLLRGALSCHDLEPRFWLFSTQVVPVTAQELRQGKVLSTGGTSGAAVTSHMKQIRSTAAVMVTDGAVGCVDPEPCRKAHLQVVLTPNGSSSDLRASASAIHNLEKI